MLVTIGDIRLVIILDYRVCGLGISLTLTKATLSAPLTIATLSATLTIATLSATLTTGAPLTTFKTSQLGFCRRDS